MGDETHEPRWGLAAGASAAALVVTMGILAAMGISLDHCWPLGCRRGRRC